MGLPQGFRLLLPRVLALFVAMPLLSAIMRRHKRVVCRSWRFDKTYTKVASKWKYLYRAVDKCGDTVNFLRTAKRDKAEECWFLERATGLHDAPVKIIIDKSGPDTAAIESVKVDADVHIALHQSKYLTNMVEHGHRATRPMLSFKSFWCARIIIDRYPRTMHMIKKDRHAASTAKLCPQQIQSMG